MKFVAFNEFKSSIEFKLFEEIRVLKRVMELTNDQKIYKAAANSLYEITFDNRKQSDIEFYQKVQYISFINCLLGLNIRSNFDQIYNVLTSYNWKINDVQTIKAELIY